MSDQSKLGLGQIITTEQERDAIHIAVAPVVAGEKLQPGEHVSIRNDGTAMGFTQTDKPIGIVDPFLSRPAKVGERFWLFLYPGSITSLRHEWHHPAFSGPVSPATEPEADKAASEKWLREYAAIHYDYTPEDERYGKLLTQIKQGAICYEGTDMHGLSDLDDADELRHHASVVLGREVHWGEFEYFSCTC